MADGPLSDYWIEIAISVGAAFFSTVILRFKAWMRGEVSADAPIVRQFLAYLAAYLVGFAAIRGLEGFWRYVVLALAAASAFAVSINGPAPILSPSYVRSFAIALSGIFVLVGLYAVLLWLGVDLVAPRNAPAATI